MPILAVDTSASLCAALLSPTGEVLARRETSHRRRHAEDLTPLLRGVLEDADLVMAALTAVAVGTGPAPFTGLRAGLVTAQTLGFVLGIPVLGVASLDVLAAQAVAVLAVPTGQEIVATSDARRREVYWARYRVCDPRGPFDVPVLDRVAGPSVGSAERAAQDSGSVPAVGEGVALYPERWGSAAVPGPALDPGVLGRLALARRAAGVEQPTEPLYLRRPDVHASTGRKRVSGGVESTTGNRP